jgi:predicted nucleic acid-binding protein
MTPLVIDSSVVFPWVFREPDRKPALELLDAWIAGKIDLIAPRLLVEEIASALCKRTRRKHLTPVQAAEAFTLLLDHPPDLIDNDVPAALRLALRHGISFWDAVYLALAIDHRYDLVTADERLYVAASRAYPHVQRLRDIAI